MTIGVLGGMGPEATAWFFARLVESDKASRDQDHLRIVVECDPSIPDRTAFLEGRGEDPLPAMAAAAARLATAGAGIAGISCMTAHAFLPRLRAATAMPFLSAFDTLAARIARDYSGARRVGVLATTGSRHAHLYEDNLPGFEVLWPPQEEQETLVMEAIYGRNGIKAGNRGEYPRALLAQAARSLRESGAELIVAGCTEVPLALSRADVDIPYIDPMTVLAEALVAAARAG